jgi:hypothetical protein
MPDYLSAKNQSKLDELGVFDYKLGPENDPDITNTFE